MGRLVLVTPRRVDKRGKISKWQKTFYIFSVGVDVGGRVLLWLACNTVDKMTPIYTTFATVATDTFTFVYTLTRPWYYLLSALLLRFKVHLSKNTACNTLPLPMWESCKTVLCCYSTISDMGLDIKQGEKCKTWTKTLPLLCTYTPYTCMYDTAWNSSPW